MFQAKSFLDNTMTNETGKVTGINQMLTTDYGIWHIDDQFPSSLVANSNESYFDPMILRLMAFHRVQKLELNYILKLKMM